MLSIFIELYIAETVIISNEILFDRSFKKVLL